MKKLKSFHHIYLAIFAFWMLSSCQERDEFQVENVGAPISLDLSAETLFLDQNFPENQALTLTWTAAAYSQPVEINYKIEASATEAFESPYLMSNVSDSQNFASYTVKEINTAAKNIGFAPNVEQTMYFRITAFLGSSYLYSVSNVTSLKVTPYRAKPIYTYTDLYMIGSAAVGNWDNNENNNTLLPLLKTSVSTKYTFTGLFKSGVDMGFKIIKNKGFWDVQYGKGASEGQLSTDGGSGNLTVPADGYYKLTIDTSALTYTLEPITNPTTTYTSVSIIGSVIGNWDIDTQLTKSSFDPHVWSASNVDMVAGSFKFRANNSWDVSWGTDSEFFGTAQLGGANIPVNSDWTYDVYFNDVTGAYTLIPND